MKKKATKKKATKKKATKNGCLSWARGMGAPHCGKPIAERGWCLACNEEHDRYMLACDIEFTSAKAHR